MKSMDSLNSKIHGFTVRPTVETVFRGRYEKFVVEHRSSNELFLVKVYEEGDLLPMHAELAAARAYCLLDPDGSVTVEPFQVAGDTATIQPIVNTVGRFSVDALHAHKSQLLQVLLRQVIDWLLSNHDSHAHHVLPTQAGRLKFIDYGQCFKYFPDDSLSQDYYPNESAGQLPPIYNEVWRRFHPENDPALRDAVVGYSQVVSEMASKVLQECLSYARIRHLRDITECDRFMTQLRERAAFLPARFSYLYSTDCRERSA